MEDTTEACKNPFNHQGKGNGNWTRQPYYIAGQHTFPPVTSSRRDIQKEVQKLKVVKKPPKMFLDEGQEELETI